MRSHSKSRLRESSPRTISPGGPSVRKVTIVLGGLDDEHEVDDRVHLLLDR